MVSPSPAVDTGTQGHADERLLLRELVRLFARAPSPGLLLREMLHLMSELLGLNRGRLVLGNTLATMPQPGFGYGLTREEMAHGCDPQAAGIAEHVLATGQYLVVKRGPHTPQFIAMPIPGVSRTIGVLTCQRTPEPNERSLRDDLVLLDILATLAGQALQWQPQRQPQPQGVRGAAAAPALPAQGPQPLVRNYLSAHSHTAEELQNTLDRYFGNQSRAAKALGLTARQFNYRLRKARDQG